jgi:hypothetical protein
MSAYAETLTNVERPMGAERPVVRRSNRARRIIDKLG